MTIDIINNYIKEVLERITVEAEEGARLRLLLHEVVISYAPIEYYGKLVRVNRGHFTKDEPRFKPGSRRAERSPQRNYQSLAF
jgi:hypothetical protein